MVERARARGPVRRSAGGAWGRLRGEHRGLAGVSVGRGAGGVGWALRRATLTGRPLGAGGFLKKLEQALGRRLHALASGGHGKGMGGHEKWYLSRMALP